MNAITHTEAQAQALQTVTPVQPSQGMLLVPLSQLRRSRRNVRTTAAQSIHAMASSIERVGLLQNLNVILCADGKHYAVVAGVTRLAALKLLAKMPRLAPDRGGALVLGGE